MGVLERVGEAVEPGKVLGSGVAERKVSNEKEPASAQAATTDAIS